jgi:nucleoside-diphosphate-sugar epimerase
MATKRGAFCYVDDLIEAMIRMMATPDDFTGPVNIGIPQNSQWRTGDD